MGTVHDLVRRHGRDEARRMVPANDRPLVDMAAAVLAADPAMGITYSGFCLTALPHKKLDDGERWERRGAFVTLTVDPGSLPDGHGGTRVHGVPYGSRARLILLYLQTQAIRSRCPEVELGASMRDWLGRMGIPIGGKSLRDVRDQADRISACTLTFQWHGGHGIRFLKDAIVRGGIQLWREDGEQPRLWVDTVRLSESFFTALLDHPVPVAEPALRELSDSSLGLDIYIWLAYRLHVLDRATPVTWAALHQQFGGSYAELRDFRKRFRKPLAEALAVYPDAVVTVDDAGLTLHPSPPPIPERLIGRHV